MKNKKTNSPSWFERMSTVVAKASGSTSAFVIAACIVIVWGLSGSFFDYSNTWQLIINTTTTITTFLMVFLIHRSQHKDSMAVHLKLNELIVAHAFASNRLVSIEDISEDELKVLQKYYKHIAFLTKTDLTIEESHSVNASNENHKRSKAIRKNVGIVRVKISPKKEKESKSN